MYFKTTSVSDPGSERAVLSGLCQFGKDAFVDVSDIISTPAFTIENNQAIYKCLSSIFEESNSVDLASIIAKADQLSLTYLVSQKNEDIDYLRALFNFPIKLENIRVHAKRIAKIEVIRKAQQKHIEAHQQLNELDGSESIDKILGTSEKPIFDLIQEMSGNRESNPIILGSKSREYLHMVETTDRTNIGIPSPWPIYNKAIGGGFRRGGVSLIVTRPKGRKSTSAINIGLHVSSLGIPVFYADTEMTYEEQLPRCLSYLSKVPIDKIEHGTYKNNILEKKLVYDASDRFEKLPFYHRAVHSRSFEEILSMMRRWLVTTVGYGPDGRINNCLILYDYFKIMSLSDLDEMVEYQAIGHQLSRLTDFAKEYDSPVVAWNQTNRSGIDKETSDIMSQSDRLTWFCANVALMKRKEQEEIIQDGKNSGNMKLLFLDNMLRHGPGLDYGNYINLQLDGDTFTIREVGTRFDAQKQKQIKDNGFDGNLSDGEF